MILDKELHLLQTLRGLRSADQIITEKRNTILIFSPSGDLEIRSFRDSTDALRALFQLESEKPDQDIVLVRADTSDEVRLAFRNYFSDAHDFIRLVNEGCTALSPPKLRSTRAKNMRSIAHNEKTAEQDKCSERGKPRR